MRVMLGFKAIPRRKWLGLVASRGVYNCLHVSVPRREWLCVKALPRREWLGLAVSMHPAANASWCLHVSICRYMSLCPATNG